MNSLSRLLAVLVVLLLVVAGGLAYLGQVGVAPQHSVVKVLPNDQFPR
jgi:hypothetical protein